MTRTPESSTERGVVPIEAIYEQARPHVGRTTRTELGAISVRDFQRFAVACDDLNPLYLDDAAARTVGYPSAVAPPIFLSGVLGWEAGPPEDDLRPDGAAREQLASVPLESVRLMGAGQDLEFLRPIVDGTRVTMEVTVEDVQLKHGRSGPLLLIRLLRRYVDDRQEPLVVCRETFIGR